MCIKSYQEILVTQVHQGLLGCQGWLEILAKRDMVPPVSQELKEILGYLASQVNRESQARKETQGTYMAQDFLVPLDLKVALVNLEAQDTKEDQVLQGHRVYQDRKESEVTSQCVEGLESGERKVIRVSQARQVFREEVCLVSPDNQVVQVLQDQRVTAVLVILDPKVIQDLLASKVILEKKAVKVLKLLQDHRVPTAHVYVCLDLQDNQVQMVLLEFQDIMALLERRVLQVHLGTVAQDLLVRLVLSGHQCPVLVGFLVLKEGGDSMEGLVNLG